MAWCSTLWNGLREGPEKIIFWALRWCYEICDHSRYTTTCRMIKWHDEKMSKLKYSIANIKSQFWAQYKEKMLDCIQFHLNTPISRSSSKALDTSSNPKTQVDVEIALWHYHSRIVCSTYKLDRHVMPIEQALPFLANLHREG